jgi:Tfp pilus assembly protein FimT
MKKDGFTLIELLVLIAILTACIVIGILVGKSTERDRIKKEAVQIGVARWEVNDKGEAKCVWNVPDSVHVVTNRTILR